MTSIKFSNKNLRNKTHHHIFSALLLANCVIASLSATSQTLFTYGKYAVSKTEFLTAFDKNPPATNRKKAMEEYQPLFINYKLKVQDGYDKRMDTLPNQVAELFNYRQQLEESFLSQQANTDKMVKEAYERSRKDILLGHLFIAFDANDSASVLNASARAGDALSQLKAGKPFETVVPLFSSDPETVSTKGKVGWITVFNLPYVFETAVYNTPKNGYTPVIKGSNGFHIFKNMDERPSPGRVRVAQILIWQAANGGDPQKSASKKLADSLYSALQKGAPFDQLALQFSNDRSSFGAGGLLPEFGVGEYDPEFEANAFALQKPGDICRPFQTSYGWHILKLVGKQAIPDVNNDPDALMILKQKVENDNRAKQARENFLKQQLDKMGYKQGTYKQEDLWTFTDSALHNVPAKGIMVQNKTFLFSVGTEKVLAENWVLYLRGINNGANAFGRNSYPVLWDQYVLQTTNNYYRENLEQYEPTFKAQLKEFKDANLLFEAMDQKVWSKAAADTAGLRKYYMSHAGKYVWQAGATALIVSASDSSAIVMFRNKLLANAQQWKTLADVYKATIVADSSRFEYSQLPGNNGQLPVAGSATALTKNALDNSFSFAYIFQLKPSGDVRSFDEARGWVINDYQQVLEEKWVQQLRKKYPVKINDGIWQQVLKVN